jgi:membrane protein required for colicin V production
LVFGFLRGTVVIAVAWLIFAWLLPREDHPKWITEAKVRPLVERSAVLLVSVFPERLRGEIGAKSDTTRTEFEELRRLEQEYQNFLSPPAKDNAPAGEPGYNSRERGEMQRAIEGIGGLGQESQ